MDNTQHSIGIICNIQQQAIIKKTINKLQKVYLVKDMIYKTAELQVLVEERFMLIYWLQLL